MKWVLLLGLLFGNSIAFAQVERTRVALQHKQKCTQAESTLSERVESYLVLSGMANPTATSECESSIVNEIFSQPLENQYVEKLKAINQFSKRNPMAICDLDLSIRSEWERRFLPLLHTVMGAEYAASDVPVNIFLSALSLLAFRNANAAKAGLIRKLMLFLRMSSVTTGTALGYSAIEDSVVFYQAKANGVKIPVDPAKILDCPGIGSQADGLEMATLDELGAMIEDDLTAQFTSMGVSLALIQTMKIWRAIRIAKTAHAAASLGTAGVVAGSAAATGGSVLASAGPQVLLFIAGIAVYKGVDYYLDHRRETQHREALSRSQEDLNQFLRRASEIAKQLPKSVDEMTPEEISFHSAKLEQLNNNLTIAFYKAREVLEHTYHLVAFYNAPMIEVAMEFATEVQKISGRYQRDLPWILGAETALRNGKLNEYLTQTQSTQFDQRTIQKMIDAATEAIEEFSEDSTEIMVDYDRCLIDNHHTETKESYHMSIYRSAWISLLPTTAANGAGDLNFSNAMSAYGTNVVRLRNTLNSYDASTLNQEDLFGLEVLLDIQKSIDVGINDFAAAGRYVLNDQTYSQVERDFLIAANKRATVQWHLKTVDGDFCRDPNAVLFQISEYFDRLNDVTNVIYLKNKVGFHFLRTLANRLKADVARNEDIANSIVKATKRGHR